VPLHGEAKRAYYRRRNADYRAAGKCLSCGAPATKELCPKHLEVRKLRARSLRKLAKCIPVFLALFGCSDIATDLGQTWEQCGWYYGGDSIPKSVCSIVEATNGCSALPVGATPCEETPTSSIKVPEGGLYSKWVKVRFSKCEFDWKVC